MSRRPRRAGTAACPCPCSTCTRQPSWWRSCRRPTRASASPSRRHWPWIWRVHAARSTWPSPAGAMPTGSGTRRLGISWKRASARSRGGWREPAANPPRRTLQYGHMHQRTAFVAVVLLWLGLAPARSPVRAGQQPAAQSPAAAASPSRLMTGRAPLDVARVLAARYPAEAVMSYIPALAWSGSFRLAALTGEDRWRQKPRREMQPFVSGAVPAIAEPYRIALLAGHLAFADA